MKKKTGACPRCCPDGGAIFDANFDYVTPPYIPVWICRNCGAETPGRVLNTKRRRQLEELLQSFAKKEA